MASPDRGLDLATRATFAVVLFFVGLKVDGESLRRVAKPGGGRAGFLATLLTVAVVMPAAAVAISRLGGLDESTELGLLIICACPGGSFSNIAAVLCGASVPLNVALTLASSLLTLALLPLTCEVVLPAALAHVARPPMRELAINLSCVAGPLLLGVAAAGPLRRRRPRATELAATWSVGCGIVAVAALTLATGKVHTVRAQATVCALALAAFGLACGCGCGLLLRQPRAVCVSMALETAIHDCPLAQVILLTAFSTSPAVGDAMATAYVYTTCAIALAAAAWSADWLLGRWRAARHRARAARGPAVDAALLWGVPPPSTQ